MTSPCLQPHQPAAALDAQRLLGAAMRIRSGAVPALRGDLILANDYLQMTREALVFATPGGARIHYRRGGAVTLDCFDPALEGECRLYLWGTVFGAVAWLNGMMPLHCSAVARDGRAIAFTAPSGGGKSTLAAALAAHGGFAHVCDDTLVVADCSGQPWAIPDGKPAKLWADALERLALGPGEPVALLPGKFYRDFAGAAMEPCLLTDLVFLEPGGEVKLEPLSGAHKLELLGEAIYRRFIHGALADRDFHARMMLMLARQVRFWRLQRPLDPACFDATNGAIARLLEECVTTG